MRRVIIKVTPIKDTTFASSEEPHHTKFKVPDTMKKLEACILFSEEKLGGVKGSVAHTLHPNISSRERKIEEAYLSFLKEVKKHREGK